MISLYAYGLINMRNWVGRGFSLWCAFFGYIKKLSVHHVRTVFFIAYNELLLVYPDVVYFHNGLGQSGIYGSAQVAAHGHI